MFAGDDKEMEDNIDQEQLSEAESAWAQREWSIQHVLFPAMRLFLKPPASMAANGTFVQVEYILHDRQNAWHIKTLIWSKNVLRLGNLGMSPLISMSRRQYQLEKLVVLRRIWLGH